ncbi:MAG: hypothetical protein ACOC7T_04180 [Planctomycetota bacterium]
MKKATFYPYDQVPVSDTTWSLHTGPDRRIYGAACIERRSGCSAIVARYDDETDSMEYLFDVGIAGGDPPDSGHPTQCKVHYSFAPSERDGILYAATHASAAGRGDFYFNIAADWGDPRKEFRGSILLAYDTQEDRMLWSRRFIPREGCRCLCYDEERQQMYAVGWPRNHFLVYDLDEDELSDKGRIGSINPQAIWLDPEGGAYTTADDGRIVRYDPDADRLEETTLYVPHAGYMSGWHTIVYDVVAAPDEPALYGVPWCNQAHMFRHWPLEGEGGRIEDLGPVTQMERDRRHPISFFRDHAGGLVFGPDGKLYYCISRWSAHGGEGEDVWDRAGETMQGVVVRLDPETLEREDYALLERQDDEPAHYVSRGGMDRNGDLFFGNVGGVPSGIFKLETDQKPEPDFPLRKWG